MPKEGRKRTRSQSPAAREGRRHSRHSSSNSNHSHKRRREERDKDNVSPDKEKDCRPEVAERLSEPKNSSTKCGNRTDEVAETGTTHRPLATTTSAPVTKRLVSFDSDSSSDRRHRKKQKKKKSKKHKKSERKHRESKKKRKKERRRRTSHSPVAASSNHESPIGPVPNPEQAKAAMAPMTKSEWEQQQSVVRKVYDPESGRQRLVKGEGEIIEEIVSLKRHKEINKQATAGDGMSFQQQLLAKKN